jgi:hypothetical protein
VTVVLIDVFLEEGFHLATTNACDVCVCVCDVVSPPAVLSVFSSEISVWEENYRLLRHRVLRVPGNDENARVVDVGYRQLNDEPIHYPCRLGNYFKQLSKKSTVSICL